MKKVILVYVITFIVCIFSQPVLADEHEKQETPWEKFSINLGGTLATLDSSVQLGLGGIGLDIDVEEALGLDTSQTTGRVEALWRFTENRRHRLDFSWLSYRRDATKTLLNDIDIGDMIFPVGTTVNSSYNFDIFRTSYSYSFFQDDRFDLAASLGVFVMPVEFEIQAAGVGAASESITAPLPVLGLRGDFAITPKVFIRSSLDVFYLQISEYTGSLVDSRLVVEYIPFKHVGFGLGLNSFTTRVEANGGDYPGIDFQGAYKFNYTGLLFYVKVRF